MGIVSVSRPVRCDVAFAHPEIPARIGDARRARRQGAESIVCVVMDVLRATTNIAVILENGGSAVHPCASVEAALDLARKLRLERGPENILLGGERDGRPVPGFDGGNSPLEYASPRIRGKTLVFSTSNGTRALFAAKDCGEVFTAAFVNVTAVAERAASVLRQDPGRSLLIACSGREGAYCEEDAVGAGVLLGILSESLGNPELSDAARAALHLAGRAGRSLEKMLFRSCWGKRLAALGFGDDVSFCAQRDITSVVPKLEDGAIRSA